MRIGVGRCLRALRRGRRVVSRGLRVCQPAWVVTWRRRPEVRTRFCTFQPFAALSRCRCKPRSGSRSTVVASQAELHESLALDRSVATRRFRTSSAVRVALMLMRPSLRPDRPSSNGFNAKNRVRLGLGAVGIPPLMQSGFARWRAQTGRFRRYPSDAAAGRLVKC